MNYKCNNCKDTKVTTFGFDQHIKFCKECPAENDEKIEPFYIKDTVLPNIVEEDGLSLITNLKESFISRLEEEQILPKKRGRPAKNV